VIQIASIHFAHAPVDHHRLVNGQVLATVPIDLMVMMKSSSIRFLSFGLESDCVVDVIDKDKSCHFWKRVRRILSELSW